MPGTRSTAHGHVPPATGNNVRSAQTSQQASSHPSRSQRQTADSTRTRQQQRQTPDNSAAYAAGGGSSIARQRAPPPPTITSIPADFDSDDLTSTEEDEPLLPTIQPRLRRPPVRHAPRPTSRPTVSPTAPMRPTRESARAPIPSSRPAPSRNTRRPTSQAPQSHTLRSGATNAATAAATSPAQESDFVIRQADGNFMLSQTADFAATQQQQHGGVHSRNNAGRGSRFGGGGGWMPSTTLDDEAVDEEADAAQYSLIARKFFTAGYALEGRGSKQAHEDLEETRVAMMVRLRDQAMQHLEETRWMYEPTERFQPGMP